jgi:hypothetical protein
VASHPKPMPLTQAFGPTLAFGRDVHYLRLGMYYVIEHTWSISSVTPNCNGHELFTSPLMPGLNSENGTWRESIPLPQVLDAAIIKRMLLAVSEWDDADEEFMYIKSARGTVPTPLAWVMLVIMLSATWIVMLS